MSAVYPYTPYYPSLDCQDVPKHVNENLIHLNGYLISWGWLREALDRFWLLIKFSVLWPLNLWWSEKINIITKNAASKETMDSAGNWLDVFWVPMMKLSKCRNHFEMTHFPWPVVSFPSSILDADDASWSLIWWWMNKTPTNSPENKMLPKNLKTEWRLLKTKTKDCKMYEVRPGANRKVFAGGHKCVNR